MAKPPSSPVSRKVVRTSVFDGWLGSLDPERATRAAGAIDLIAARGSTLGRPHVDTIHGGRLHKLKEARVDRSIRMLFAFDSNSDLVMLVGGDKAGKWNRWYPDKIKQAERLYQDHERSIGKEPRCLSQRAATRNSPQAGR